MTFDDEDPLSGYDPFVPQFLDLQDDDATSYLQDDDAPSTPTLPPSDRDDADDDDGRSAGDVGDYQPSAGVPVEGEDSGDDGDATEEHGDEEDDADANLDDQQMLPTASQGNVLAGTTDHVAGGAEDGDGHDGGGGDDDVDQGQGQDDDSSMSIDFGLPEQLSEPNEGPPNADAQQGDALQVQPQPAAAGAPEGVPPAGIAAGPQLEEAAGRGEDIQVRQDNAPQRIFAGRGNYNHPGNKKLLSLVQQFFEEFYAAPEHSAERRNLVDAIIARLEAANCVFVGKDHVTEISRKDKIKRVRQCMRTHRNRN